LLAVAPALFDAALPQPDRPAHLRQATGEGRIPTLGRWGDAGASSRAAKQNGRAPRRSTRARAEPKLGVNKASEIRNRR